MINETYVNSLANYIINGVINPKTSLPFVIEDIKKEEYIEPVKMKIEEMEVDKNEFEATSNKSTT
ncbi:hypothetical protein [Clostridium paraputrificum]|uniref:hypothetical protein n=1 Tax=Clostridium paraputrificum TaxID=29363 RepID=UPI000C0893BB|nr:hypothetical protein [Clostridium paraputrificum]